MKEQTFQRVAPEVVAPTKRTNGEVSKKTGRVLVVVRESSAAAFSEFVKMLEAILNSRINLIPGASKVLQLGDILVRKTPEAEALRKTLNAEPKYAAGSKVPVGWLFDIEGTLFFLGLYSAGKPTIRIDDEHNVLVTNEFTRALGSIVEQYKVDKLYTGPLHRILRSKAASMTLRNSLILNETEIICSDQNSSFKMETGPGQSGFDLASWMIDFQYKGIVQGLTNGTHRVLLRGQWPKTEDHLPALGYRFLSAEDHTPVPDLESLELVRDFIALAAKPEEEVSSDDLIAFLAKSGWGSRSLKKRELRDEKGTIADAKHPRMILRHLLEKGLPLWETGVYNYEVNVPSALLEEQLLDDANRYATDNKKEEDKDGPTIYRQSKLAFGISFHHEMLPEGRWVSPELIALAKRRLEIDENRATGRLASDRVRKPLTSVSVWEDDEREYKIASGANDLYLILSRPLSEAVDSHGRRNGWPAHGLVPYMLATVKTASLHKTLAETIISTLSREAVTVSRKNPSADYEEVRVDIDDISESLNKARRRQELAEKAGDAAIEAGASSVAARKFRESEEASKEATALEAELSKAYAAAEDARPLSLDKAEVGELAATLAELSETENQGRPELNSTLRRLIARLEASLADNGLTVEFKVWLRLVSNDGPVTVGPISFSVANRRQDLVAERHEAAARYVLADGMREAEAMAKSGYDSLPHMRRRITKMLADVVPSTYLRSAIVDCPIPETKAVVWEMLDASLNGRAFSIPEGIDRAFSTHIRNTYGADGFAWAISWAAQSHELPRAVMEYVLACGTDGAKALDLQKYASTLGGRNFTQNFIGLAYRGMRKGSDYEPILERGEGFKKSNPDRKFLALRCPFCDTRTLTHTLRVPEVPGGVICTSCRRVPSLPTVIFPEAYLRNWDGPRGVGIEGKLSGETGTIEAI